MTERDLLMIPGPTNVDPQVLRSMARPTISHTSAAFATVFKETVADLGKIFQTKGLYSRWRGPVPSALKSLFQT